VGVRLSFVLRSLPGLVDVSVEANAHPEALGCGPQAEGFPVCRATVGYEGRGYVAALGWIQLVRSTDGESAGERFELDPFEPLGRTAHPFCWFGFAPTLFDAPSRTSREPLDWTAHSFLGFIGERDHEARAILGFHWGFAIRDGTITITKPAPLAQGDWDAHLPLLRGAHPEWEFAPGYHES
jgi:hypothetical protein